MNRFDHQWQKLIVLARQAPADPGALPYGFATRLAAQAAALPAGTPWLSLERFALRGLVVAAVCGVIAAVFNFSILTTDQTDIYATGATETVVEMLDIS